MAEISGMDYPLIKIKFIWFSLNRNLNKENVAVSDVRAYKMSQCDTKQFNPKMSTSFGKCPILSLSVKHNFTLVDMSLHRSAYYDFETGRILGEALIDWISGDFYSSYEVRWDNIQFMFVAPFPTGLTGIRALLSPFSETVWTIIIICCLTITLIIKVSDTKRFIAVKFIIDFFNVASILLGQVSGYIFVMFHNKKWVAIPILTVWFLGGRYLTMDNLYVGSIYSFLSAVKLPILPDTLKSLVDSDIPIITMSTAKQSELSILKAVHIPEYIEIYKEQKSFVKLLQKLNYRLVSFEGLSHFEVMAKVFGNVKHFQNVSLGFDRSKVWGIMDDKVILNHVTSYIKLSGRRKIIHATDGTTPFRLTSFALGRKTFLFPIFQKGFGQLSSSGLITRWHKMGELYVPLKFVYRRDKRNYERYFFKAMSNGREPITFHESDPVSMKAVKESLALCGTCLIFGIVSIILECKGLKVKYDGYLAYMEFSIVCRISKYLW
ncbi:hypothetical protein Fcan01_26802 [Folsomia candida]|uniref:Uncharacterized protein n=1 Tax=Folsomia candida TaxID=158441 RepID=A0A226CZY8_FOLCA|nr:hypothetical protein Fcan01_26802 [Folsomia candida]